MTKIGQKFYGQRFMTELNSPVTLIYISTQLSRMLKQRVRGRNFSGRNVELFILKVHANFY